MPTIERLVDRAGALTVIAFLLLSPPVLSIFAQGRTVAGVPVLPLYAFGAWLIVIAAGGILAHRLQAAEQARLPRPSEGPPLSETPSTEAASEALSLRIGD